MKIHMVLGAILVMALICQGESQITFSRAWVRGKLPGEERVIRMTGSGGRYSNIGDDISETYPAFPRNAKKAQLDFHSSPPLNFPQETNKPSWLFNLRRKFVLDFLQRMRYPYPPTPTRFKEEQTSSSESSE